ncbi:hypothetical protein [Ruminococcus sp.]|uniref:phage tail protein n=1 Tax=Ruminococcus sp. TaxID=41978 RepID=UPI0025D621E1|nr:hypothetical protein [Ruminococcus sp.]
MTKAFKKIGKAFQSAFRHSKEIEETSDALGDAAKETDSFGDKSESASVGLKELTEKIKQQEKELNALETEYKDLCLRQGESGDEAKKTADKIKTLSSGLEYNKSILKSVEDATDDLKKSDDKLEKSVDELDDSSDKASDSVRTLGDEAKNTDGKFTVMKGAIADLIAKGFTKLIELAAEAGRKLVEFGKDAVEAAAAVSAENSSFDQIMGDYAQNAQKKLDAVASATGVVNTRLTASMTSMTAKFKGLGFDVEAATTLAADGLSLASDAAAFWDKSLDDSMGALNSFLNGSYEGGEAIGLFANDTQMAAYAIEKGVVADTKAWQSLDEATKQATRLEYAQNMMTASGAVGQAAKESDQYANTQANLTEKWRQFKAEVGEPILQEFVNPAMEKLSGLVDKASEKFQEISPKIGEFKDKLGEWWDKAQSVASFVSESFQPVLDALKGAWDDLKEAVSPLTEKLSAFVESGGAASTAMSLFSGACDAVATAIGTLSAFISPVISTISSTIAEHLPKWKEHFQEIGENLNWLKPIIAVIGTVFAYVVSYVTGILNGFISALDGIFQVIEGIFQSFEGAFDMIVGLLTGDMDRATDGALNMQNGMVNIFGGLWNTVSGYLSGFLNGFKDTFSGIYEAVSEKFGAVKTFVSGVVDWLKGIFDFNWSLPEIKLPHFSMTGEFSIDPPSVPHFGIEWYAKGAVLNQPTIFGLNPDTGAAMIGGEAGAEAVAPISTLQSYVRSAVQEENGGMKDMLYAILSLLSELLPQILTVSGHEITMDKKTVAKLLAPEMNRELGTLQTRSKRGVSTI